MAFWTFNQNNSGGVFDYDEDAGITHFVVIEANSLDHAIERAKAIGIYFDGCASGIDCDCCGDRWSTPWDEEGALAPMAYSTDLRASGAVELPWGNGWMKEGHEAAVHPLSGPVEWYGANKPAA